MGETSDRLRRTPPPQHPHPTTHMNKAPRSARSVRASCYRHDTVEEVLSPFIFVPPKQKADPLLSSSAGRHGGGTLAEPSSSPSETPGRHSTSQPYLTASLVSFHHQSLSHRLIFLLLMLKLTTALICRYDATPPLPSQKKHFSSPSVAFPFVPPQSLLSFCLSLSCNPPLLLRVTSILIFLQLI